MLREALSHAGYDQEEAYFYQENRRLIAEWQAAREKRQQKKDAKREDDAYTEAERGSDKAA